MPLSMEVGLGPGDFVFDGDLALPDKQKEQPHPIFGPCLTARWIKMPFGTKVNFRSGNVVSDWVAAPPKRGTGI